MDDQGLMTVTSERELTKYAKIGFAISTAILILVAGYLFWRWPEIVRMTPNEFGDLLAGILGPLALLWLILGFFQPGQELRQSVRALELQSKELRNSVEQQKHLVEVTRRQAEAEIAALDEERAARKRASSPHFNVRQSTVIRTGEKVIKNFKILNTGDIAADVSTKINGHQGGKDTLGNGESYELPFPIKAGHGPSIIDVNISAKNRFGETIHAHFVFEKASHQDDAQYRLFSDR